MFKKFFQTFLQIFFRNSTNLFKKFSVDSLWNFPRDCFQKSFQKCPPGNSSQAIISFSRDFFIVFCRNLEIYISFLLIFEVLGWSISAFRSSFKDWKYPSGYLSNWNWDGVTNSSRDLLGNFCGDSIGNVASYYIRESSSIFNRNFSKATCSKYLQWL